MIEYVIAFIIIAIILYISYYGVPKQTLVATRGGPNIIFGVPVNNNRVGVRRRVF